MAFAPIEKPNMPMIRAAAAGAIESPLAQGFYDTEPWLTAPNVLRMLWRRMWMIVLCAGVLSGLGIGITLLLPQSFQGETLIVVDPRREQVSNVQEVMPALPPEQAVLRSEVDALESSGLIRDVVEHANLISIPEFNPNLEESSVTSWMFWLGEDEQKALNDKIPNLKQTVLQFIAPAGDAPDEGLAQQDDPAAVAAAIYRGKLNVTTDGRSLTMRLVIKSRDPELAAKLANLHAQLYLARQLDGRAAATERVHDWLSERIAPLRANLQQAEAAVQKYREEHQLITGSQGITLTVQQLAELNTQLSATRVERAQNQARLDQVRGLLASGSSIDSVPDVLSSPVVQKLREQESIVMRLEADAASRYTRGENPAGLSAKAQLAQLRRALRDEISKIATSLQRSVEISAAKERTLETEVQNLTKRAAAANLDEVKLRELERDAESTRGLYQTFLNRVQETSLGPMSRFPDSRIISTAEVPLKPSFPKYKLFYAASIVVAVASGVGLAILLEATQDRLRSPTQCSELLGIYGLGLTPQIKARRPRRIADSVVDGGIARDAVRSVFEILYGACVGNKPRSISITSAVPHEGKTILAIWLARVSSMMGLKVLLVDADLRRPTIAKYLGERERAVRGSDADRNPALVREDPVTGLHYMTYSSGGATGGVASLRELEAFLSEARANYDLVIVDCAPILPAPESLPICQMTEGTVFAVHWGVTPPRQVRYAMNLLRPTKANILGVVVTRANVRKHSKYAFGDIADVYYRHTEYFRT